MVWSFWMTIGIAKMADALLEVIGGLIVAMLGGLGWYVGSLNKRLQVVEKDKADLDDVTEIKTDVKKLLETLTKLQIELARWQGRAEVHELSKPEKS